MASYKKLPPDKKTGMPGIKITVELGYDERGKRIRDYKTVRMKKLTDRAIKKAITEFEIEVSKKQTVNKEKITFETFVKEYWMPLHVKKLGINTYQTYKNTTDNYILPYFKTMQLTKIKPLNIEEFFANETKEKRKNLTGKFIILKSIFSCAVKWEFIQRDVNPMNTIEKPTVEKRKRERYYYTEEELKLLVEKLETAYPKHRIAFKMAAFIGLRRSEILGIRHHCIDYEKNEILIDAQLHYDTETHKFLLGPPKNKKSRVVFVPESFMKEIKEYADEHKKQRELCGSAWTPIYDEDGKEIDLLFTNPHGYPNHKNSITNEWRKFLKRHNLPFINFHGLRHSFASYLVENNGDYKVIQEQLGHSSVSMTINIYSHITNKKRMNEVSKFEELLKK